MEYKGLPLFGDDSNPRNTSKFFGIVGTCILWFIFVICMIIIRPAEKEKRKYKDVQIVFEALPPLPEPPVPVEEVIEPEVVVSEENLTEEVLEKDVADISTPVVENKVNRNENKKDLSASSKNNRNKNAKKESAPAKKAGGEVPKWQQQQQMAQQKHQQQQQAKEDTPIVDSDNSKVLSDKNSTPNVSSKPGKEEFDWSLFDTIAGKTSDNTKPDRVNNENSFSGTAGTKASENNSQSLKGQSQDSKKGTESGTGSAVASVETKKALDKVEHAKIVKIPGYVPGDGGDAVLSLWGGYSGGDDFFMKMEDGDGRSLIKPAKPSISLSSSAAADIDVSKTVTVTFTVLPGGNVPEDRIYISPAAALPESVMEEIKNQVGSWLFEGSNSRSIGKFEYKIIKN